MGLHAAIISRVLLSVRHRIALDEIPCNPHLHVLFGSYHDRASPHRRGAVYESAAHYPSNQSTGIQGTAIATSPHHTVRSVHCDLRSGSHRTRYAEMDVIYHLHHTTSPLATTPHDPYVRPQVMCPGLTHAQRIIGCGCPIHDHYHPSPPPCRPCGRGSNPPCSNI